MSSKTATPLHFTIVVTKRKKKACISCIAYIQDVVNIQGPVAIDREGFNAEIRPNAGGTKFTVNNATRHFGGANEKMVHG